MNFLTIISIQISLMIIGYMITILLKINSKIESLGLSYLLGSGLITIIFLTNHFLFKIDLGSFNFLVSIIFTFIFMAVAIFIFNKQGKTFLYNSFSKKNQVISLKCFEKFILFFLVLILSYTLFENYSWPVTTWDSLALYDFRAKVIALNGNMIEGLDLGYFFQYPPYTSFLHVFGYVFGVSRVKVVYSFIYFSLLTVFYSLLRRNQERWLSLLGTLMLAIDNFIFLHTTIAYTNLSYVVFLSLGLIYLAFWISSSQKKDLLVGSLLIAFSTWVRASDPFWYISIIIIIAGILKNKKQIKQGIISLFLLTGVYKYWDIFVGSLSSSILNKSSREASYIDTLFSSTDIYSKIINTIPEILTYYWQNISLVISYLLPLLLFTFYYDLKQQNSLNKYLYLFLSTMLILILVGITIFSLFFDTWNQIGDSLQRMSMVLIPVIIFIIFNSSIWKIRSCN